VEQLRGSVGPEAPATSKALALFQRVMGLLGSRTIN
jgi:hypothetical protein